jgi:hypothetical protein
LTKQTQTPILPVASGPIVPVAETFPQSEGGRAGLRAKAGAWLHERWKAELILNTPIGSWLGWSWRDLHNRIDQLSTGSDGLSRVVRGPASSYLTVARTFPRLGATLFAHCFAESPIELEAVAHLRNPESHPDISIVIPYAGLERFSQLQSVIASFGGQIGASVEVLVVHPANSVIPDKLPNHVVCHAVNQHAEMAGFNKSRLFNAGVAAARAEIVLLHDADILVPRNYVACILDRLRAGSEAVSPIRFLFYLDRQASHEFAASGGMHGPANVESVRQNFAGGSIAILKAVYESLGGYDEEFCGWGGEDVEFFDRLAGCRMFLGSYAPAVHLWHSDAPQKSANNTNLALAAAKCRLPVAVRIRRLRGTFSSRKTCD